MIRFDVNFEDADIMELHRLHLALRFSSVSGTSKESNKTTLDDLANVAILISIENVNN